MKPGRRLLAPLAIAFAFVGLPATAAAHPLGNFTINHYSGLRVAPDAITVDHVIDMAEIPAFQERRAIDVDGDGALAPDEEARYRSEACERQADRLVLIVNGSRLRLEGRGAAVSFPPGVGGLVTLRLVCELWASLPSRLGAPTSITFTDPTYGERIGWREVAITGDHVAITDTTAPATSVSARLMAYPQDLLSQPLAIETAHAIARPGGPALPPLEVPELGARATSGIPAAAPGGVSELVPQLAAALGERDLSPAIVFVALLVAFGLGAYHAITPGHGKTVMAAYLVGTRGNSRDALVLGGTVALAHTLGVLMLAGLVFVAQRSLPPERLVPWLSLASGLVFIAVGAGLVRARYRDLRAERAHLHEHAEGHGHTHTAVDRDHGRTSGPLGFAAGRRTLFALGFSGGLVPAPSALLVFLGSITLGRPAFGLVLVLAFGVGMAIVLGGIGLLVARARGPLQRRLEAARFGRTAVALQFVAALVVLALGTVLTVQSGARLG